METLSYNMELLKEMATEDDGAFAIEAKVEGDELSGQSISPGAYVHYPG